MRGRILALTAVAFLGSYPIGGPITGIVGDQVSLQWSLVLRGDHHVDGRRRTRLVGPRTLGRDLPVRGAPQPAGGLHRRGTQPRRASVGHERIRRFAPFESADASVVDRFSAPAGAAP